MINLLNLPHFDHDFIPLFGPKHGVTPDVSPVTTSGGVDRILGKRGKSVGTSVPQANLICFRM